MTTTPIALVPDALKPLSPAQVKTLGEALGPHERLLELVALTDREDDDLFLMLTTSGLSFARFLEDSVWSEPVPAPSTLQVDSPTLGKIQLLRAGELVAYGGVFGPKPLLALLEHANLTPLQRTLNVAKAQVKAKEWELAHDTLGHIRMHLLPQEEEAQTSESLSPHQHVLAASAQVALARGRKAEAIAHLSALGHMRSEDTLMASTEAFGKVDPLAWRMMLVLAHEERANFALMAKVYGALADDSGKDHGFRLQQARSLAHAGDQDGAAIAYAQFISAQKREPFHLILALDAPEDQDLDEVTADPDLLAACLELGALQEESGQTQAAADTYMLLIQQAPFALGAYTRFFGLPPSDDPEHLKRAAQLAILCRILCPKKEAEHLTATSHLPLPHAEHLVPLPHTAAHTLLAHDHDHMLVHPGERRALTATQKAVNQLMQSQADVQDIVKHCQQVQVSTHPDLAACLGSLCHILSLPLTPCYLSHGMTGIQVRGDRAAPLLLLGAAHVATREDPQALTLRQQYFALGTQLEHIRAGHLILTSSEMWGTIRDHAMTGATSLLSLVPLGELLGGITSKVTGSLLGGLGSRLKAPAVQSLLDYTRKKVIDEGGATSGIQTAYEATLTRLALKERAKDTPPQSMLKEQVADFARSALYTADRFGLLACGSLEDAVQAILRLSARTAPLADQASEQGLGQLLGTRDDQGNLVYHELALRLGELFKFALSDDYFALRHAIHDPLPCNFPEEE